MFSRFSLREVKVQKKCRIGLTPVRGKLVRIFVLELIRVLGDNWWTDGVPQNIRVECARRQEEEGESVPEGVLFGFDSSKVNHGEAMEVTLARFRHVGLEGGKAKMPGLDRSTVTKSAGWFWACAKKVS